MLSFTVYYLMTTWKDIAPMTHFCWAVLMKACSVTKRKSPQDGSNVTQNQSDKTANPTNLYTSLYTLGSEIKGFWTVSDMLWQRWTLQFNTFTAAVLQVQNLDDRNVFIPKNKLFSQLSTGAGTHKHCPLHSHSEHTESEAGRQTVLRQTVL